ALMEWPAHFDEPRIITAPCVTSDIFPTLIDATDVTAENLPPLDGVTLLPLVEGKNEPRAKPIGFWNYPAKGIAVPSKKWMDELLAAQSEGREIEDQERLATDAGKIGPPVPLNRFPGHSAWLDGNWKIHRIEDPQTTHVTWELYDLAADPDESRVLLAEQPERVPTMQHALEAWLESVAHSLNGDDYAKP
ncbi:MAG: N-acetylgalactosamine-6-sulfatase, partial [Verrucomicrobiaceae bacterium]|nr:N-acetylgalactosamine-6-sulfatase [Verrucomicrobiaceae bacterium]